MKSKMKKPVNRRKFFIKLIFKRAKNKGAIEVVASKMINGDEVVFRGFFNNWDDLSNAIIAGDFQNVAVSLNPQILLGNGNVLNKFVAEETFSIGEHKLLQWLSIRINLALPKVKDQLIGVAVLEKVEEFLDEHQIEYVKVRGANFCDYIVEVEDASVDGNLIDSVTFLLRYLDRKFRNDEANIDYNFYHMLSAGITLDISEFADEFETEEYLEPYPLDHYDLLEEFSKEISAQLRYELKHGEWSSPREFCGDGVDIITVLAGHDCLICKGTDSITILCPFRDDNLVDHTPETYAAIIAYRTKSPRFVCECPSCKNRNIYDVIKKIQEGTHAKADGEVSIVLPLAEITAEDIEDVIKPQDIAGLIVRVNRLVFPKYLFHNGDFYRFDGKKHVVFTSAITKLIATTIVRLGVKATRNALADVTNLLEINLRAPSGFCFPSSRNPAIDVKRSIKVANGIIVIPHVSEEMTINLLSHTPEHITLHCLDIEFKSEASCPIWSSILSRILNEDDQRLLQEWFGLCLINDTSFEKFLLLIGEGANGKSLVLLVLSLLLGKVNCSAVSLESFTAERTFPLAALDGKLVNIAEEIGEVGKVAEGLLKQIISGGMITIEKKHQDPFETRIGARLIFSTNVLPPIADRSNGVWRRMLLVNFEVQIPEHERNRNYINPEWWLQSGEMPGILNWAIDGLVRLLKRGHFVESVKSLNASKEYKLSSNPTAIFLDECCVVGDGCYVQSHVLYSAYVNWTKENGYRPLSAGRFSPEVKRRYQSVTLSEHPVTRLMRLGECERKIRSREWVGIRLA